MVIKMILVDVCINLPIRQLNKTFTYFLPEEFTEVDIGWRVGVSFGYDIVEGFILNKYEGFYEKNDLKAIEYIFGEEAWFDKNMLSLSKWISEYYLCTLAEAMRLFLPGKKSLKKNFLYSCNNFKVENLSIEEIIIIKFLKENPYKNKDFMKKYIANLDENILNQLIKKNIVKITPDYGKKHKEQKQTIVKLIKNDIDFANEKYSNARKKVLEMLLEKQNKLSLKTILDTGISRDTLKRMQTLGIIDFEETRVTRNSYSEYNNSNSNEIILSEEQQTAVKKVYDDIQTEKNRISLLFGITGSGKTEVYLDLTKKVFAEGKQVLVLVPEIALTGQTIQRFQEVFFDDVLVVHSKLSVNERMDVFEYIKKGHPCILIGVRSAVFAPFKNLGLIIMDEEHEYSYKQEERPGYQTRDVLAELAKINNIPLILGSATPSLESYHKALQGEYDLLKLSARPVYSTLPEVIVVDMKEELQKGNKSVISEKLMQGLKNSFSKNEQAIILLNRRGHSTFILCRDCGHVVKCPHCDVSLVYHQSDKLLRCHYCEYTEIVPDICPSCKSRRIKFFGTGTQKAEEELKKSLQETRIVRMDQDTTSKKMAHDEILSSFKNQKYDLLLGTQMVAKGHDMHNVTLVGVLSADAYLNIPDFRAAEKTFALLTQATGRAGRGNKKGLVILQVYESNHKVIKYVVEHDYENFANEELQERSELFYPPFSDIIKIYVVKKNEESSKLEAQQIVKNLKSFLKNNDDVDIRGPFQGFIAKIKDTYKTMIIIKTKDASIVKKAFLELKLNEKNDVVIDIDPINVF